MGGPRAAVVRAPSRWSLSAPLPGVCWSRGQVDSAFCGRTWAGCMCRAPLSQRGGPDGRRAAPGRTALPAAPLDCGAHPGPLTPPLRVSWGDHCGGSPGPAQVSLQVQSERSPLPVLSLHGAQPWWFTSVSPCDQVHLLPKCRLHPLVGNPKAGPSLRSSLAVRGSGWTRPCRRDILVPPPPCVLCQRGQNQ